MLNLSAPTNDFQCFFKQKKFLDSTGKKWASKNNFCTPYFQCLKMLQKILFKIKVGYYVPAS